MTYTDTLFVHFDFNTVYGVCLLVNKRFTYTYLLTYLDVACIATSSTHSFTVAVRSLIGDNWSAWRQSSWPRTLVSLFHRLTQWNRYCERVWTQFLTMGDSESLIILAPSSCTRWLADSVDTSYTYISLYVRTRADQQFSIKANTLLWHYQSTYQNIHPSVKFISYTTHQFQSKKI